MIRFTLFSIYLLYSNTVLAEIKKEKLIQSLSLQATYKPIRQRVLTAKAAGVFSTELYVGSIVEPGQLIGSFDCRNSKQEANYIDEQVTSENTALQLSSNLLHEYESLSKKGSISKEKVVQQAQVTQAIKTRLISLKANLYQKQQEFAECEIVAEQKIVINALNVSQGQYVARNTQILSFSFASDYKLVAVMSKADYRDFVSATFQWNNALQKLDVFDVFSQDGTTTIILSPLSNLPEGSGHTVTLSYISNILITRIDCSLLNNSFEFAYMDDDILIRTSIAKRNTQLADYCYIDNIDPVKVLDKLYIQQAGQKYSDFNE